MPQRLTHICGPYRVQYESPSRWDVYQPNGTIVASCAREDTARTACAALNACAVLPELIPA